jgi:hypothetical protein
MLRGVAGLQAGVELAAQASAGAAVERAATETKPNLES